MSKKTTVEKRKQEEKKIKDGFETAAHKMERNKSILTICNLIKADKLPHVEGFNYVGPLTDHCDAKTISSAIAYLDFFGFTKGVETYTPAELVTYQQGRIDGITYLLQNYEKLHKKFSSK